MININNKVNPSNGVDFSRIRRHASGGSIPKFKTPFRGIDYKEGTSWRTDVFMHHKDDILLKIRSTPVGPQRDALIELYNKLLDDYATMVGQSANPTSDLTYNDGVKAYQTSANSLIGTNGLLNGYTNQRYLRYGTTGALTGKFLDRNLVDGYRSGITHDWTSLGYGENAWDVNQQDYKDWLAELKKENLEMFYDDTNKTWKFRPLSNSAVSQEEPATAQETTVATTGTQGSASQTEQNPWKPVTFSKPKEPFKFKKNPFTAWIPSLINHYQTKKAINELLGNELQKKVPLSEALYLNYTITDDKATTDAYNQAGANIQSLANRIASLTSNLELNQAMQLEGARLAEEQRLQGQLAKTQAYNQSVKEAQQVANWNNQLSVATTNSNRQNLVADWNAKLNAKSAAAIQHATNTQNLVNNISGDYSRYVKDLRQNAYNAIKAQNDYQASLDTAKAQEGFYNLLKNPMLSNAFNNIYNQVWLHYVDNPTDTENPIFSYITENDVEGLDEETKKKNLYNWLNTNSSTTWGKQWATDYDSEATAAKDLANYDIARIKSNQARTQQYFPLMISDQGFFRTKDIDPGTYYQSIYPTSTYKQGGVLSAKNGSRMVKYMEHKRKTAQDKKKNDLAVLEMNRKSRADLRKQEQQAAKQLQESLKRELESLDRETLLLLRSVFK